MNFESLKLFFRKAYACALFIICSHILSAQIYGLKFQGQDVTLDKRTELNLTPDGYIKFQDEFEISFDYKIERLKPNSTFGYVFRIINSENHNVDLLNTPSPVMRLNIVAGKNNSYLPIDYPANLIGKWVKLRMKFLLAEDRYIFYTPDSFYVTEGIGFKKKDEFKIIFGANDLNQFKTTDVPSISIKNLQIAEKGILKYEWPLNENEGFVSKDRIKGHEAQIKNPVWLSLTHQVWQTEFEHTADSAIMVAVDEKNERLFIIGARGFWIYSADDKNIREIGYSNKININPNTFNAIYNSTDNRIYCYDPDNELVCSIDVESGFCIQNGFPSKTETRFRHHNRFYHSSDNSIYLFGGYGFHKYTSEIRKIDLATGEFENPASNNAVYEPRYLAGLGELNDTVYILGGYGSTSGDQLINPHSYYNLLGYDLKSGNFFKKFEIPRIIDDMALANSIWIDANTRNYYALIFEKSKFDGYLQLVKGNLDAPVVETAGNKIPFQFLDIRSFSGLFYLPVQQKLFAYTTYLSEDNKTRVSLYSISYPPDNFNGDVSEKAGIKGKLILSLVLSVLLIAGVLLFIYQKRKKNHPVEPVQELKVNQESSTVPELTQPANDETFYHIGLFGGFQVFNKNSEDITNYFSPLLKELFLLIFLYSFKNNKGISSEKLTEILWFDKSEKSARNNRAVNIAKLKGFLEEIGSCELSKKTGYWKIGFEDSQIKSDYFDFLNITSSKKNLTKQKVIQLIDISQKGGFLINSHYEWLDEFKALVSDRIMDTLVEYGQKADIRAEAEFIIHLADCIFNFDLVNEEAMLLKCKAQYCMGKHSHAKATYDKFFKEYSAMYNQEYDKAFADIINFKD